VGSEERTQLGAGRGRGEEREENTSVVTPLRNGKENTHRQPSTPPNNPTRPPLALLSLFKATFLFLFIFCGEDVSFFVVCFLLRALAPLNLYAFVVPLYLFLPLLSC
jgi:hypothetical protein